MEIGNVSAVEGNGRVKTEVHKRKRILSIFPNSSDAKQYLGVVICGLAIWGCSVVVLGRAAAPGGWLLGMAAVSAGGYVAGHALARLTTLPPLLGMTLAGVLFRNLGVVHFHTHPAADTLDYHLRRIYPVVILTKGPLGWDWDYIRTHYMIVFALATLPWIVECLSMTTAAYYVMGFTWKWGIHLGSIIASVSPAVVVPAVVNLRERGYGVNKDISRLVACAGGLDTALTEGMFGVINAALFIEASDTYRIVKALLAIVVGVALGVGWGVLADHVPDHRDPLAAALKSGILFWGGLLLVYAAGSFGWGGTAGVGVMVCAATAATRWRRRGWPLNANPVAEVFRVLWNVLEPMLFSLSGYYLEIDMLDWSQFARIVGCLVVALALRMLTAFLVSLAASLTMREGLFISITWMPKAIVEAVLVRVALDSLPRNATDEDRRHAQTHVHVIVIAIVLTSSLGSALTTTLGPVLLKRDIKICPEDELSANVQQDTPPHRSSAA